MAKYQKYVEYKDSGVRWLGAVPSHWIIAGFKKYLESTVDYRGKTPEKMDEGVFLVTARNIKNGIIDYSLSQEYVAFKDYDEIMSRGIPVLGDVLFTTEAPLGEVAQIDNVNIALAQRIIKFRGKKDILDNTYLKYFILSQEFQDSLMTFATGSTALGIKAERIGYLQQCIPPIHEQTQIANFLDHETAKIDHLIEKQHQLIELLKEKRQAVISHAVTKGLNPNVPMKDSGVAWLGEVPGHWDTTKIKYVAELTPKKSEVSSNDNRLCTFVPMEKLKLGSLIKDEEKPISEVIGGYTYFKNGDLLLAKVTPCFENKNMVVASDLKNGIGFGSSEIYVLRTNHKVNTQFLYYRLQEDQFMELGTGAMTGAGGLKRVPSEFLNNFEFALPPLSEQIAITKYLNQYLIKNEYLMNKAQSAIQLMQERRTALISAAVTGKIDVRHWQSPTVAEAQTELSA